jgi:hypothetical protein
MASSLDNHFILSPGMVIVRIRVILQNSSLFLISVIKNS